MNNTKSLFAVGAILVAGAAVVGVMFSYRHAESRRIAPVAASTTGADPRLVPPPSPQESESPPTTPDARVRPEAASSRVSAPPAPRLQPTNPLAPQPSRAQKKPELQDPLARAALSLVGADPDAEAYWLEAIYDAKLPEKEREDLMEDLNEDGLSDPKRPGQQDVPLIVNRIAIIEEVAPFADDFMLPHLQEAYKDLLNLAEITQGGGRPIR